MASTTASTITTCDERGRIVLPQPIRERYGTMFHIVGVKGEIILLPATKDPLKSLAELGRKAGFHKLSIAKIKEESRKQAQKEL